jgi:hypothetical protein
MVVIQRLSGDMENLLEKLYEIFVLNNGAFGSGVFSLLKSTKKEV